MGREFGHTRSNHNGGPTAQSLDVCEQHAAFEQQTLIPAFSAVAAASAIIFLTFSLGKDVIWPAFFLVPTVLISVAAYFGVLQRLERAHQPIPILLIVGSLSAGLFMLVPSATLSELSLCLSMCLILTTLQGQSFSQRPYILPLSQFILFAPTGLFLLFSGERQNLYLVGIVLAVCSLIIISRSGYQKLLLRYVDASQTHKKAEENAEFDLERLLERFHPFSALVTHEGNIISFSRDVALLLEQPQHELTGQSFAALLNKEHATTAAQILAIQRSIVRAAEFEFDGLQMATENDTQSLVKVTGLPCSNGDVRLIIHSTDISDREKQDGINEAAQLAQLLRGTQWRATADLSIKALANDDDPYGHLLTSILDDPHDHDGSGISLQNAMHAQEEIDLIIGPTHKGDFIRCLGRPLYDREGVFAGYIGLLLPTLETEAPLKVVAS